MKMKTPPSNVQNGIISLLSPYAAEAISGEDVLNALRAYRREGTLLPTVLENNAITIKNAAKRLSCSSRKIWRMINSGELKSFKLGARSRRIPSAELDKYFVN